VAVDHGWPHERLGIRTIPRRRSSAVSCSRAIRHTEPERAHQRSSSIATERVRQYGPLDPFHGVKSRRAAGLRTRWEPSMDRHRRDKADTLR